jgi:hypothetical protein
MVKPLAQIGATGRVVLDSTAFIAPHSGWPHTTTSATLRTNTAHSIALAFDRSQSKSHPPLHGLQLNPSKQETAIGEIVRFALPKASAVDVW